MRGLAPSLSGEGSGASLASLAGGFSLPPAAQYATYSHKGARPHSPASQPPAPLALRSPSSLTQVVHEFAARV